LTKAKGFG